MKESTFEIEKALKVSGFELIIGIDEVGRGPLCGPVVASAAIYRGSNFEIPKDKEKEFALIRDSKTLSEKQREKLMPFIHEHFYVGIGMCDHQTVDRINILEATFLAMKKAITDLKNVLAKEGREWKNLIIVLDGNKNISHFSEQQRAIPGGDGLVKSISAASIVAKVARDTLMQQYDLKYPQYGFAKHKGYGTKQHMDALGEYGPCPIHRLSFAPVGKALKRH